MEVAAGGSGEVMVELRYSEAFSDEMDDALFGLEGSGDAQEGNRLGQGRVPLKDVRPEDDVHEVGLILQA